MDVIYGFALFSASIFLARVVPSRLRDACLLIGNFSSLMFLDIALGSLCLLTCFTISHYYFLKNVRENPRFTLLCYLIPLGLLFVCKLPSLPLILGVSYLSFRMLSAFIETQDETVQLPSLSSYLLYCFYFPSYKLGPIGSLSGHCESFRINFRWSDFDWIHLARVLYGGVKLLFISQVWVTFATNIGYGSWDNARNFKSIVLIGFFSYIRLYLEFSGFCDIVIGASAFFKIKMKENFSSPYLARNLSIYWNRWHISLGDLLKKVLFYPLNMHLLRKFGRKKSKIITPCVLILLFIAIGVWHGLTLNFLLLGLFNAAGVVVVFYYGNFVSKRIKDYESYRAPKILGIILTQVYVSCSFLFFDNHFDEILKVLARAF